MSKIAIGGIIAGFIMFFWSFLAHMFLPVGYMGISATQGEDAVLAALKANAGGDGLYLMPGYAMFQAKDRSGDEKQKAMQVDQEKGKTAGFALIVYHPEGDEGISGKRLGLQFFSQVIVCWIFSFALWAGMPRIRSFGMRVWLVSIMGLLPFVGSDFPSWNWYGFPGAYMVGKLMDYWVGAILAGIFLAWWFGRAEAFPDREARAAA